MSPYAVDGEIIAACDFHKNMTLFEIEYAVTQWYYVEQTHEK